MNSYSDDDIYMVYGPSNLAGLLEQALQITAAGFLRLLNCIQMTKPIVKLAHQVNDSNQLKTFKLNPTGLFELDELSQAIELANKRTLESASRLAKIVELFGLPIGAYEINHEANTVFVTHNFYSIIAWEMDNNLAEIDAKTFAAMLEETLLSPVADEKNVYEIGSEGNKWIRFKQAEQENVTIGVVLDVTDEILEKRKIMRERDHDPLTTLLNRKGFQWSFETWAKSCTYGKKAALVMFDLDNLKSINDTYGHKWGDHYIITAVDHLKRMAFPDGDLIPVMISAGVMWTEGAAFTYDELLHFADEALYEAKRNHKGSYIENNQV